MPRSQDKPVRAIALVGPSGAGKTTLAGALASICTGKPAHAPQGPGVETAITAFDFMDDRFVILDTPGAADFAAELDYVLPAVDLALVVADPDPAKAQLLQPCMRLIEALDVPRALFINRIDQAQGGVRALLEALQPMSRAPLVIRQIPIWKNDHAAGFIDLALERAFLYREGKPSERIDLPADQIEREADARFHMLEQLADFDDGLMEQLLSDMSPSRDAVFADLTRETRERLIAPVFLGGAQQGFGLRRLLKALRHDTPQPNVAAERLGLIGGGAYVFKISHAGQMGKLAFARGLGAPLVEGAHLQLSDGAEVKLSALFALESGAPKKSAMLAEGEVGALGKLEPAHAGDLLSGAPARALAPEKRFAVYALAIASSDRKDDVRLSSALTKLVEEDPGLTLRHSAETQEIILEGLGEAHLRHAIERIKQRYGLDVVASRPQTAYRETIRKSVAKRGRHKKQSGGHGQFGDVVIEVAPLERGAGFSFSDRITGGAVPKQWIPAVEHGVRDAMEKGPLGAIVTDVAVTLTDGSYHSVDSSEHSFRAAGRLAMSDALAECEPIMLEPIEKLAIATPSSATSRINAAVSARNGQILGFAPREGWSGWDIVEVYLPHAELHDFILELRSLTQGLASYTAAFAYMAELVGRRAEDARKAASSA